MKTWLIRIRGIVQGVGFRPFVYQRAHAHQLKGYVSNGPEGVIIGFQATVEQAKTFYQEIIKEAPSIARITSHQIEETDTQFFDTFEIRESQQAAVNQVLFTPDYALCGDCRKELRTPTDRRYAYPFITCTNCGPRFSIIQKLPYDREHTTMDAFNMCPTCEEEYHNPLERRHYSQTNSCKECGIQLTLHTAAGDKINFQTEEELLQYIPSLWTKGNIIAIKGIGGYLLTCDAQNQEALIMLRQRKQRPVKPFALMYPSVAALKDFYLSPCERKELESEVSPILLLKPKESLRLPTEVVEGVGKVGVMIPYAPLFQLLMDHYQRPIVATSGNISRSPIIFRSEDEGKFEGIADYVLGNDREILIPQDDSVICYSPVYQQKIILRRSRGLAPNYFYQNLQLAEQNVLACGADLKSSFTFLHEGNVFISQYLGDLSYYETQQAFKQVLAHFQRVLGKQPTVILHDLHPQYSSTFLAGELAKELDIQAYAFQHHKAHFAAILGEHELLESNEKVLGVIWDGTGYGEDGQIWGGEFFLYENKQMERVAQLNPFPILGGDKMAKEPRLSAFSLCPKEEIIREKFSATELKIYDQLLQRAPQTTSSMGRFFDAVAALLGICFVQNYEGEAAMKLQAAAEKFSGTSKAYEVLLENGQILATHLVDQILIDVRIGLAVEEIALKFHLSLVEMVRLTAEYLRCEKIAFSGGVFQNALLVDLMIQQLGQDYTLHFHKQLSSNDENISFGQLMLYQLTLENTLPYVSRHSRKD
ncbi:MAG: carbamoyltransferase HypF [Bacteroidota bacterium]